MIVVKYEEVKINITSGEVTTEQLGSETHTDIEEVLLPDTPSPSNPIFFTKKFHPHTEYRWEVVSVSEDAAATDRTYIVKLRRKQQVIKRFYLKNILADRARNVGHVIKPWSIVEVEFGHALTIGKLNGDIRSTKRYADTIQTLSMPKRRLAIVIQVHSGKDELVQVIPISSKAPRSSDTTCVDVTSVLINMTNYQKPSWAICRMIQTVTASRIMAPNTNFPASGFGRDSNFRTIVRGELREQLKDALMHGVGASGRVEAAKLLKKTLEKNQELGLEKAELINQLQLLTSKILVYEKFASYMDKNLDWTKLNQEFGDT